MKPPTLLHLCVFCEQEVPEHDWASHQAGRDAKRLVCPLQDVGKVAAAASTTARPGTYLARGTGLARVRW